jgi:tRNA threonylcarbamoyladenosine biosynthesis protein TsaE
MVKNRSTSIQVPQSDFMNTSTSASVSLTEEALAHWLNGFIQASPAPAVILLEGSMGAGKTTFTRLLGEALGVQGRMTSPSFITLQEYQTVTGVPLLHLDLYRLEAEAADALLMEVEELLTQQPTWVMVEWGSLFQGLLPQYDLTLYIEPMATAPELRRYTFTPHSPNGVRWVTTLLEHQCVEGGSMP